MKVIDKLNEKITVMLIPDGKASLLEINISLLFMCVFMILWMFLTLWSGYLTNRHFDYVKTKVDNKIMRARMLVFADQLEKVREDDEKIRLFLAMDTKKSILEEGLGQNFGKGGPTLTQANTLAAILSGSLNKINYSEMLYKADALCEQYKFMCRSYKEIMSHIHKQEKLFMTVPSGWPCRGRISSVYGFRVHPDAPLPRGREFHSGLDIANRFNTPISSTAAGKVIFSGYRSGYGNVIVINHGQGGYGTIYAHLSKRLVNTGAYVPKGSVIAKMGSTGISTGSHLHYEVLFKEKPVNPSPYLINHSFAQYIQKKIKKPA